MHKTFPSPVLPLTIQLFPFISRKRQWSAQERQLWEKQKNFCKLFSGEENSSSCKNKNEFSQKKCFIWRRRLFFIFHQEFNPPESWITMMGDDDDGDGELLKNFFASPMRAKTANFFWNFKYEKKRIHNLATEQNEARGCSSNDPVRSFSHFLITVSLGKWDFKF